jgi:hypothetical protein
VTDAFYTAASAEERRGGGSDLDRHYVEDGKGDLAWLAPELGGGQHRPGRSSAKWRALSCCVGRKQGRGKAPTGGLEAFKQNFKSVQTLTDPNRTFLCSKN